MIEILTAALLVVGTTFLFLASVGVLRMPDLYCRMQPATKASTLGAMCTLLALAVHFRELELTSRAVAGIAFFLLTAPVTAHVIGRAGYLLGVPLWEGTVRDDLRAAYERAEHAPDRAPAPSGASASAGIVVERGPPAPLKDR